MCVFQSSGGNLANKITRKFDEFGAIEAIEMLNNLEAYVLFAESECAFEAFQAHQNNESVSNSYYVMPANTWHQPESKSLWNSVDPGKCYIFKLNDDCLLEFFGYCDLNTMVKLSKVCTRFQDLLKAYYFPKIATHTTYVYHVSLSVLRDTMKCIGPYLVHLFLRYHKIDENSENYLDDEQVERKTFKILQYITSSLIKLTIRKPHGQQFSNKMMELFRPAFGQIRFLEWDAEFDCNTIESLRKFCPNLECLLLKRRIFSCKSDHNATDLHWPSLKRIELFQYMSELSSPCQRFFERFIRENPQLKRLKLTNCNFDLFQIIAQHSQNLEQLEMLQNFNLSSIHSKTTFDLLNNLNKLRIFIFRVKIIEFLPDVLNLIETLSEIHRLQLIVLLHNYAPSICSHEFFPLAHQCSTIAVDGNTVNLRIGENSASIKFDSDRTTLVNVFNANNPRESSYKCLRRDIRRLFRESNMFFPNVHKSSLCTFKNSDCRQFIHVNSII